ncbi:probable 18S rRNA (guanine-n(7))-methyltransferase [Phtheirospermum japonicum]|uniref:Probable 18S rRNA (Guanine-n(7))-methyltransferase n=1 Tax=Phtheirospermum japonicum TaxID=374723 RepID=A0A830CEB1_9LAMI|nr:probable 18S rRNA (guanine-n(7))-methyltransferase [Phtheirospermum japonicum]
MASRPELQAPPEIFYNDDEARKYTSSSRIIDIQAKLSERALELLALPDDGMPRLLLDIGHVMLSSPVSIRAFAVMWFKFNLLNLDFLVPIVDGSTIASSWFGFSCGSGLSGETLTDNGHHWIGLDISPSMLDIALEREADGDLILGDMGQGLGLRPGVIDGAISISAVQWLCNADKSSHEPRLRLKAFFGSLYRCLARGARAVLQVYPENLAQRELILGCAMRAGFSGGVVVDYPHRMRLQTRTGLDYIIHSSRIGLGLRPGVIDGAISISAVQWLCNADKSSHEPRLRLKAFFGSLYRCLARGARAVLQVYPENLAQRELILGCAMRAGFSGGVVVDYPHSTKQRKEYLVLSCGPPSLSSATPQGKGEDGESCSDDDMSSGDEENQSVHVSDRNRPRKKQKLNKKVKGKEWVLKKKEQMRRKGNSVPLDTKYTARKRKARF